MMKNENRKRHLRSFILLLWILIAAAFFPSTAFAEKNEAAGNDAKRYIVTCNYHFDNRYNTLGKYKTLSKAKKAIRKQDRETRGQWFIFDSLRQKVVWPDLSTKKKKIKKAVSWAKAVANDRRHGYCGEGFRGKANLSLRSGRWGKKGDYSCTTVIATAYDLVGLTDLRLVAKEQGEASGKKKKRIPAVKASTIGKLVLKSGCFCDISRKLRKSGRSVLQPGDLVVMKKKTHAAIYIGNDMVVEATANETNHEYRGYPKVKPGDQTGFEIRIYPCRDRWYYAYRPMRRKGPAR